MPDWIIAVVLGVVEGLTEFIPVSSTGHLLIAEHLLRVHESDLFNIVIQCGAVLAVLPLFSDRLRQFAFGWRDPATQAFLIKIAVAFGITGIVCLVAEKKGFKLPESALPVAVALLVGGILFIGVEWLQKGRQTHDSITWPIVLVVAAGQILAALLPGSSRSGATILFALVLGLNRVRATEFSFLVGIPTMLAAGGWKIFQSFHHPDTAAPPENWGAVAIATIVAAVVSFVAVRWLLRYVQTHTFTAFGWYRVVLAIVVFILMTMGMK